MDSSTFFQHRFISRAEAVGFIEDLLTDRIQARRGAHPSAAKVAKRRKIPGRLMPGAAETAAFEEHMESLEGLLDPSELSQMRAEFMVRKYLNSPCAPSWRSHINV